MALSDYVNTFGQLMLRRYGERVHKVALNVGLSCPNRDGSKGRGGCTFCNNGSFAPQAEAPPPLLQQIDAGRQVVAKRTGAHKLMAYFQAYTNTHAALAVLEGYYRSALAEPDVIGISVGTRPDCVSTEVLVLLCRLRDEGAEVWLELGLQSSFDATLERVNRGHSFEDYRRTLLAARERGLSVCTHLILGLPGENGLHARVTLDRVLELGVDGLKLHPLHVVKKTVLAKTYQDGGYSPLGEEAFVQQAVDLIERTPPEIVYHRVTATSPRALLVAPSWCTKKWAVLNGIEAEFVRRGSSQGSRLRRSDSLAHSLLAPAADLNRAEESLDQALALATRVAERRS